VGPVEEFGSGRARHRSGEIDLLGPKTQGIVSADAFIMADEEKHIRDLENQFPALSGSAFAAARERTLAAGQSVLQSFGGAIYEVFPDGTRKFVKQIETPIPVTRGAKFIIQ